MAQLRRENQELKAENERLRRILEEALRASQRQASPLLATPSQSPTPETWTEKRPEVWSTLSSAGPEASRRSSGSTAASQCPRCGGGLEEETVSQFQTGIPPQVERIEFRIQVGRCRCCRRRVQGRHPQQTSKAIAGAASRLGPKALALATHLNKGLGLPYGKTATVLEQAFALRVSRGSVARREALQNQPGRQRPHRCVTGCVPRQRGSNPKKKD
jgi:transposase